MKERSRFLGGGDGVAGLDDEEDAEAEAEAEVEEEADVAEDGGWDMSVLGNVRSGWEWNERGDGRRG